ncbi:hypothetical protein G6F35_018095 [Rhizopus arrhizus]|nr:hypothetical protein G6F35_018095 [Rhizopus arrhizus]
MLLAVISTLKAYSGSTTFVYQASMPPASAGNKAASSQAFRRVLGTWMPTQAAAPSSSRMALSARPSRDTDSQVTVASVAPMTISMA